MRERLVQASAREIVVPQGLIAHGRGEAFDYVLGEKTTTTASNATRVAASLLITAKHPVVSVNGNAAALAGEDIVRLASIIPAQIEINLFHASQERQTRIAKYLKNLGARQVLHPGNSEAVTLPGISSQRAKMTIQGIGEADVILIPLEDGDRAEALKKIGKTVIAIDLNPLSRTSSIASVTIVDNIVRAIPALIKAVGMLKKSDAKELRQLIRGFNNETNLEDSVSEITKYLQGWRNS